MGECGGRDSIESVPSRGVDSLHWEGVMRGRFVMGFRAGHSRSRGMAEYLGVKRGQGSTDVRDQARGGTGGVELRSGMRLNYGPRICLGPLGSLSSFQSGPFQRLRAFHSPT